MITAKRVELEIKKKFGLDVKLYRGSGYFYFDDAGNDDILSNWPKTSVYVATLNQLSLAQWIDEFKGLMDH